MHTTHPQPPATASRLRRARLARWAAPLLALSTVAACGSDSELADEPTQPAGAAHDAFAAEAARYVELQLDRAAEARS